MNDQRIYELVCLIEIHWVAHEFGCIACKHLNLNDDRTNSCNEDLRKPIVTYYPEEHLNE